ncbi:MAG: TonB-dependent siderophore receptor [Methylobacterium mesophilicum]|nr:TonB-dependent siderophore receptor [Methylobacterium mesophilicum]
MVHHGRTALLGSAAMLLVMAGGHARAQDNGATAQLEEVVVEGQGAGQGAATGPVDGYVARATATGSKTATPIQEIPQAVSVVGRDEIDDRGAQKVDEALRYTAGVFSQPFGNDADTNWVYVRGFDATQTGIYQDGLQLYGYAFGSFFVDSYLLERIEVLKGPASVLYGGANPGGVVNYVSKRPTPDAFNRVEAGIDSFGVGYFGFDIDGPGTLAGGSDGSQGGVDYRVTGRIYGGEGFYDNEEQFRGVISPSITWSPDEATKLTLLANYTYMDNTHGVGSFLPYEGTVVDAPFGRIDRDFNPTEPSIDNYKRNQASIGYEFEHTFDNDVTVRQNARYSRVSLDEAYLYGNGLTAGGLLLDRVNFSHDTTAGTFLIDNQVEGKVETGPLEHTLLAGIDYKYFNIDQTQSSALFGTTTPIDPEDPAYGVPQTEPVSYLNQDLTQQQLGVYLQDQIRFGGGWLVTLNGRYDRVWTEAEDGPTFYAPTQDDSKSSTDGELSGRAGIAYEFANGVTPYASAATFFNPVVGVDTFGDVFTPETGQQYEVGVKYAPTWFEGVFTASLFDLTRENVVTTLENNAFANVQVGEIRSRGFEFEAKANLDANWRMTAALTAFDLEVRKDDNESLIGNQPFLVPDTQASLSLDYTFRDGALDGVTLGGGVRYIGSSWADRANTLEVPSATLADAKIGYRKNNWGADLTVTNLFDKNYVAGCQGVNVCSYGEARKALVKVNFEW